MNLPLQWGVYKGVGGRHGAAQFKLVAPHFYCSQCKSKNFNTTEFACKDTDGEPKSPCPQAKMVERAGSILLEATSTKEGQKNVYDWENKVIFALGLTDLGKVLRFLRTSQVGDSLQLLHDPGAQSAMAGKVIKTLYLSSPQGIGQGLILSLSAKEGDRLVKHSIPLSGDEVAILGTLVQAAIPKLLSWA